MIQLGLLHSDAPLGSTTKPFRNERKLPIAFKLKKHAVRVKRTGIHFWLWISFRGRPPGPGHAPTFKTMSGSIFHRRPGRDANPPWVDLFWKSFYKKTGQVSAGLVH